jgi:hypothetical protein
MSVLQANCPACGAPVEFNAGSSVVVVCKFCKSVVARTDRSVEDLGKVAEIAETGSPLAVGLRGKYQHSEFQLTGRAQLAHAAGGMWDEWYAAFSDNRWGWLAEAQGKFYLTFASSLAAEHEIPSFDDLEVGRPVASLPVPGPLIVAEKASAKAVAAEGEIPWRLTPGETFEYADLSGPNASFATIDFSESPPLVFIGREVTLEDLGLAKARAPERGARPVAAAQLACPQCGGPLKLRAPDRAERVTCPNCRSLLDVDQGELKYLKTLEASKFQPSIPLGAVGSFAEGKLTVLGFVVRSVLFDRYYYWSEYLLYNPQVGFRWLVESDGQWSYVKPVPPGEVADRRRTAAYRGNNFRIFQDATATVQHVIGEFYWKVTTGEEVRAIDYVRPPEILTIELSHLLPPKTYKQFGKNSIGWTHREEGQSGDGEMNCSLGTYMKPGDVEKAFGISGLKRAWNIAPNQPNPFGGLGKHWLAFVGLILLLGFFFFAADSNRQVFAQTFRFDKLPNADGTQTVFSEPFQLAPRRNIAITAGSNVDNTWVYFEGDLINQDTGLVQPFALPVQYYHGVDEDGSWTDGSKTTTTYLSALPAGMYTLRLEGQWERWQQRSPDFNVRVVQGVPRGSYFLLALGLVSAIPIYSLVRRQMFEVRRWNDSMYSSYGGGSNDD